jgi:hypothetical protein
MADTPMEIKTHPQNQINPPSITQTIERDYWVCKIVWWQMELTRNWVKVILEKPKVADTFNWSKEERQKLNEEVLVWNLRKKLLEKYPEQKCFFDKADIRVMQLWDNFDEHNQMKGMIKWNIFLLFWIDWKLLSYLNEDWKTNFDISNFNFDNDFGNLLNKKLSQKNWNSYIINKDWKLFLYNSEKDTYYPEWSHNFNVYIFAFYLKTLN